MILCSHALKLNFYHAVNSLIGNTSKLTESKCCTYIELRSLWYSVFCASLVPFCWPSHILKLDLYVALTVSSSSSQLKPASHAHGQPKLMYIAIYVIWCVHSPPFVCMFIKWMKLELSMHIGIYGKCLMFVPSAFNGYIASYMYQLTGYSCRKL